MEWDLLISSLSSSNRTDLSEELQVLTSIYTTSSTELPFSLYVPSSPSLSSASQKSKPKPPTDKLVLHLSTTAESSTDTQHPLNLLISIPSSYPSDNPPSIQLADIYLGPHLVSDTLFGSVLRTYMHEPGSISEGVEFIKGEVVLYEGIEFVRSLVGSWIESRDNEKESLNKEREKERGREEVLRRGDGLFKIPQVQVREERREEREEEWEGEEEMIRRSQALSLRDMKGREKEEVDTCPVIISSEPLVDRKSAFIGHAARIHSIHELNLVLNKLLSDKRIAKASHNMYAYHISQSSGIVMSDNSDDGESAAGGRLAHLLSLIDVTNVVVVVSRWFGGIHLGSDRFKHINSTAREALELGGFLDDKINSSKGGKKVNKKK